ncbi:hypothetical protein NG819_05665 [Pseudarthrobacter sp. Fe7]|nr:hypothetical protein NG819_05665 [Pseudarthrobacter sp. Fe7]
MVSTPRLHPAFPGRLRVLDDVGRGLDHSGGEGHLVHVVDERNVEPEAVQIVVDRLDGVLGSRSPEAARGQHLSHC